MVQFQPRGGRQLTRTGDALSPAWARRGRANSMKA